MGTEEKERARERAREGEQKQRALSLKKTIGGRWPT